MKPAAFFVTGTDTEVGKTTITTALLYLARDKGLTTAAGKPVASGAEAVNTGDVTQPPHSTYEHAPATQACDSSRQSDIAWRNSDALALQRECQPPLEYSTVNPFVFEPAIAPHIAAAEAGVELTLQVLSTPMQALLAYNADFTLIEGAGGWRVPINHHETLADLAKALALPVIVVVGIKLGAINHACLTLDAIRHDGLEVAGWVANLSDKEMAEHPHASRLDENLATLSAMLPAPCLGIVPHLEDATPEAVSSYLDIDLLLTSH
ncbi:ATP-dependent dethiobiotin synthetase BioD 1 [Halomonadaceae bacterium LMG 33818]|uniref:dethiobiotin synthase n=1 Tax=Cernens ardua TaxID=3402176 RepID=UPI003EDC771E